MGAWRRCPKCRGMVEKFVVIQKTGNNAGKTDDHNEARRCLNLRCRHMEVVSLNSVRDPVKVKKRK